MDIECFNRFNYSQQMNRYIIENPVHRFTTTVDFYQYEIQPGESMRIDLIMQSIYDDPAMYSNCDIILYINGIDNPLNLKEGQIINYIDSENFSYFRYTELGGTAKSSNIKQSLAVPSKTTRTDINRAKFIESDYTLPPVLLTVSQPSVTIDSQGINVGGLK